MGRLAGFRYREVVRRLKVFGFEAEGTLRAILKQAGISPDDFLNA